VREVAELFGVCIELANQARSEHHAAETRVACKRDILKRYPELSHINVPLRFEPMVLAAHWGLRKTGMRTWVCQANDEYLG
jgi:hypothetical protein